MVWFKVDDRFHRHKKVRQLEPNWSLEGLAAVGMWTLCGDWAADEQTDGFVPSTVVRGFDRDLGLTQLLLDVDLWERSERDGEIGIQFHDWEDWQPTSEEIEKKRADVRERVRRYRQKQAGGPSGNPSRNADGNALHDGLPDADDDHPQESDDLRNALRTKGTRNPNPKELPRLGQSDQETLRGGKNPPRADTSRGARIPEDFSVTPEMVEWARTNAPHVDGRYETAQFVDYWRSESGARASKKNWTVAWYRWMRKAEHDAPQTNGASRPAARSSKSQKIDRWQALKTGNATRALPQREQPDDDL